MSTFEEEEHVIEEYSQIDEEELNTVEEEEERVIKEYFLIDEEELNTVGCGGGGRACY